jgi:hypothetical protein
MFLLNQTSSFKLKLPLKIIARYDKISTDTKNHAKKNSTKINNLGFLITKRNHSFCDCVPK